jgi:putative heme-binding domain-containing protein
MGDDKALAKALAEISGAREGTYAPWQFAAMAGLLDALERQKLSLDKLFQSSPTHSNLESLFTAARSVSLNSRSPEPDRLVAIRLLARGPTERDQDIARLGELLRPEVPNSLQEQALAGLRRGSGRAVAEAALAGWKGYGPGLRTEVLNLLLSRPEWTRELLAAMEREQIATAGIGTVHQQKLLTHPDESVRQRAGKLFAATRADRQALLKDYRSVGSLTGDAAKGAALFRQNCSICHLFKGEGHEIGVDLNTMAGKPVEVLLTAILDPNQAVEARYVNYTAVTRGDREVSGVIAAETANSITMRSPGGNEEVLLRSDLKELTSSGLSLMPEGFEKALDAQAMADLLAYILAR